MLRVGVLTEVDRRPECATGLAEHLKAFAVQPGRRRELQLDIDEHGFLDSYGGPAAVDEPRSAQRPCPVADQDDVVQAASIYADDGARQSAEILLIQQLRQRQRRQREKLAAIHGRASAPARRCTCVSPTACSRAAASSGDKSRCGEPSISKPTMNLRIVAERSSGG